MGKKNQRFKECFEFPMTEKNLSHNCVMAVKGKVTPLQAIRERCKNCSGAESKAVRECPFDGIRDEECPLYFLRMGKGSRATLKRIKAYCLWCCCGQSKEVRLCPATKCSLWIYRFGKRPSTVSLNASDLTEIRSTEAVF